MIKESIHEEDKRILNTLAPNNTNNKNFAPKIHETKITELSLREREISTIIVGNVRIPLSGIDKNKIPARKEKTGTTL